MKILPWYLAYAVGLTAALGVAGHRSRGASGASALRRRPQRILVVGGTGGTGRELLVQSLKRGYQVTAMVRNPSAVAVQDSRLTIVQGDVKDLASVERAMVGVEAVVSVLGHRQYYGAPRLLSLGTHNIMAAMKSHNVPRIVCATSLGVGDSAGRLGLLYSLFVVPTVLPFYFWDKARQERMIAESDFEWVIVRPGRLTDAPPNGRARHGQGVGSFLATQSISRADVAAFMLDQLETDTYLSTAVGVVG